MEYNDCEVREVSNQAQLDLVSLSDEASYESPNHSQMGTSTKENQVENQKGSNGLPHINHKTMPKMKGLQVITREAIHIAKLQNV